MCRGLQVLRVVSEVHAAFLDEALDVGIQQASVLRQIRAWRWKSHAVLEAGGSLAKHKVCARQRLLHLLLLARLLCCVHVPGTENVQLSRHRICHIHRLIAAEDDGSRVVLQLALSHPLRDH
eukprot:scaffold1352_cov261-Pinguiococcus_pyrenoidosus.AAC.9